MKSSFVAVITATIFGFAINVSSATADTLKLKDGTKLEGVIKKIEGARVYALINAKMKVLDLRVIEVMEFTPDPISKFKVPSERFTTESEAREMVRNIEQLDKSAEEIQVMLSQMRLYWATRQPIDRKEEQAWAAAKETFRQPVMAYQEVLNDLYFHVLARVDEYNSLMQDASKLYVGIKGIRFGSPLIPSELEELPLKKYVPGAWYDTIFYEGYNAGSADATARLTAKPN
jgi:hypothetical protein